MFWLVVARLGQSVQITPRDLRRLVSMARPSGWRRPALFCARLEDGVERVGPRCPALLRAAHQLQGRCPPSGPPRARPIVLLREGRRRPGRPRAPGQDYARFGGLVGGGGGATYPPLTFSRSSSAIWSFSRRAWVSGGPAGSGPSGPSGPPSEVLHLRGKGPHRAWMTPCGAGATPNRQGTMPGRGRAANKTLGASPPYLNRTCCVQCLYPPAREAPDLIRSHPRKMERRSEAP